MSGHLPTMPNEDHDFTPEIARKIIILYRTRIDALEAENAKIRGLAEDWHAAAESREFSPTRDELKAENERLRAMLSKVDQIASCRLICDTNTMRQKHDLLDALQAAIKEGLAHG